MVSANSRLSKRIDPATACDPSFGVVRWSPVKSLWWTSMAVGWVTMGTLHFSLEALGVFFVLSGVILCLGHSIGMHRKLIHDAFECPYWLEVLLVYLGTLVGLGGPFSMMRTHDLRDWAQRQPRCHAFLAHQRDIATDFWWQIHCDLQFDSPPAYRYPDKLLSSPIYRMLQGTSMAQQIPLAVALFAFGGWGWVAWGVCGRVTVSIFGHWIIGYFAHNHGHRDWHVEGAAVQGYNVPYAGLITFGECWHNNHHAFPGSAKLGLYPGQADPGWVVLKVFEKVSLVTRLKEPMDLPRRAELSTIDPFERLGPPKLENAAAN